jgi:predicted O-methyltransferase YrrM
MEFPNWFKAGGADDFFARNLMHLAGHPVQMLQIGAYTGDATQWLFDNVLTHPDSSLVDVDPWTGSGEEAHEPLDWSAVESYYDNRNAIPLASGRLTKARCTSDEFFAQHGGSTFDFIYVDGDHKAASVLIDGIHAIRCIRPGGIVAFDDYMWTSGRGPTFEPKPAIDAIRTCFADELELIDSGLQVWLKRRS